MVANRIYPSEPAEGWSNTTARAGDIAVWFLYKGEAWDIGRIYDSDGQFRGYYVDAVESIDWSGDDPDTLLPIVDLFLDLWISRDLECTLLDQDELFGALDAGWIGLALCELARSTIDSLRQRVRRGTFPAREILDFVLTDETTRLIAATDFRPANQP